MLRHETRSRIASDLDTGKLTVHHLRTVRELGLVAVEHDFSGRHPTARVVRELRIQGSPA